jgi:iron(III) transport system permease protein
LLRVSHWPVALGAILIAALVALPVGGVALNVFAPVGETWTHLASTVLPDYVINSLLLALLVGAGVLVGGVTSAWLVTICRFPGRRFLELALVLPLAMPAYVVAYAYTDLLEFSGPVQAMLRALGGWGHGDYWFPQIRSLGGAAFVFTFVLYPYVYLLARASFLEQSVCTIEVSRSLGHGALSTFFRVALPLARPALAAGTALALMETLADYGAVAYFGVPTFTTGIYRAWVSFGDRAASAQLAMLLLAAVVIVLGLERISRGRQRFHHAFEPSPPRSFAPPRSSSVSSFPRCR